MSKPFLLIDETMTLHGIRFLLSGGTWDRFSKNPVMLYMHVRGEVIGQWVNIRLEGNAWVADPDFDLEDPAAKKIAGKVERGYLKAASPGVAILEADYIDGELWATKWEPFESSIVDAGSNPNALQLYTTSGELVKDAESYIKTLTLSIMSKETTPAADAAKTITLEVFPKAIALAAGLLEDATADAVSQKVTAILEENRTLKLEAKTNEATRVKDLVDTAYNAKKITDGDRDHYLKLGALDFDSTKAILDKIQAPVNLAQFAADGGKVPTKEEDKAEFDRHFKANTLIQLQAENPDKFKRLFKAEHGIDYEG